MKNAPPVRHYLSNIDRLNKTATCAICGPTRIVLSPTRTQCMTKKREYREKYKQKEMVASYGISQDQYDLMWTRQRGRCAMCGEKKKLVIDHCHKTGKVRGLLCDFCNRGLGCLRDNPRTALAALLYLAEHSPTLVDDDIARIVQAANVECRTPIPAIRKKPRRRRNTAAS